MIQYLHRLSENNILTVVALVCAIGAAAILVTYLLRRSPLDGHTRYWLLFGLGVLPIGSAMSANVQGYETTKHRQFCASCHVMGPHARDAEDPNSHSLAAIHARSPYFGSDNCYACHADYGLFGTVVTKLGGLRHVWLYATDYHNDSLEDARRRIHLINPYPNSNCMQCHTATAPAWSRLPDHQSAKEDVIAGKISCASAGCHAVVHPLTKGPTP